MMLYIKRSEIRIEDYESLVSVSDSSIEVKEVSGLFKIAGEDLRIVAMCKEEVVLGGKIKEILFL